MMIESLSVHMFLSCRMGRARGMAYPIAWSGVDQAGPGAPPPADPSGE